MSQEKPPPYSSLPPEGSSMPPHAPPPPQQVPGTMPQAPPGQTPKDHFTASGPYPSYQQQTGSYQSYQSGAPPGPLPGQYGGTPVTIQPQQHPTTHVVIVGGCPACRVGVLEDDFTILGVLCAIVFFPLGILCCLAMRQRRCPNCGAIFG